MLTETQIREGYFSDIGGFPSMGIVREVKEYKGGDRLCIACTQLDGLGFSEREKKRMLAEWIDFLRANPISFRGLHFNSHVPQALFDAACCQENLEELRFKWGAYADLSVLKNLRVLKFLYIGSGASVQDISVLGSMKNLVVLFVENFKRIEDYSLSRRSGQFAAAGHQRADTRKHSAKRFGVSARNAKPCFRLASQHNEQKKIYVKRT